MWGASMAALGVDQKVNSLSANVYGQLGSMNTQITTVNNTISELNKQLTELKLVVIECNHNIDSLTKQNTHLSQQLENLKDDFKSFDQTSKDLKSEMIDVKKQIETLFTKMSKIISFIPYFVRQTSTYFVEMLVHLKTGVSTEPPTIEYNLPLLEN